MKLFLTLFSLVAAYTIAYSQLDPFYFGTYLNEDFTEGYIVYTMDEVEEDCFIVEYEMYEDGQIIYGETGYGHCDGEDGHMQITMETSEIPLNIEFSIDDNGLKLLTSFNADGQGVEFKENNDFQAIEEEIDMEIEVYFLREDGSALLLFPGGEEIEFHIMALTGENCESNDVTGIFIPINDEGSKFEYILENGCRLEFQSSDIGFTIIEENCENQHDGSCVDWNGIYIYQAE